MADAGTSRVDHEPVRLTVGPRLRTLVAGRLREAIALRRLPPGRRLVERELCDLFGVSRTSVREALRELESEGLVSTRGGRPMVAVLTPAEMQDVYEVRTVLEGLAARLFVRHATPDRQAALRDSVEALGRAAGDDAVGPFLAAKARFYEVLLAGSGNRAAAALLRVIHAKVALLRATSLSVPGRVGASVGEIRAIAAAVAAGDEDLACRLTARHIEQAWAAARAVCEAAEAGAGFGPGQAGFAPGQEAAAAGA